ncbi:hypothetical protein GO730_31190 [Spirosoma sp. HMF3257]|uniref:helix-turn-helix domain-containing protein n=1 Tax=Spirosoma telluris TaxID=2183553 RepID=UPI0011B94253|nr:hypothetical protein [Spirosoma telluris]
MEAELQKCDLVCANCHCEIHSDRYTEELLVELATYGRTKKVFAGTEQELAIITDKQSGMTYKEIMEKYGILSKSTINNLINRKSKYGAEANLVKASA